MEQVGKRDSWRSRAVLWGLVIVAALGLALLLDLGQQSQAGPDLIGWNKDYAAAEAAAAQTGQARLVYFGADWCGPCKSMSAEVFSQPEVAEQIRQSYLPVKVDLTSPGQAETQLAQRYNAAYIPTMVIVRPSGEVVSSRTGYLPANDLLAWLATADTGAQ